MCFVPCFLSGYVERRCDHVTCYFIAYYVHVYGSVSQGAYVNADEGVDVELQGLFQNLLSLAMGH